MVKSVNSVSTDSAPPPEKRRIRRKEVCSAREKNRNIIINQAFNHLSSKVPFVPEDASLSKIKTLRLAMRYIEHLSKILKNEHVHTTYEMRELSIDDFASTAEEELQKTNTYKHRINEGGPGRGPRNKGNNSDRSENGSPSLSMAMASPPLPECTVPLPTVSTLGLESSQRSWCDSGYSTRGSIPPGNIHSFPGRMGFPGYGAELHNMHTPPISPPSYIQDAFSVQTQNCNQYMYQETKPSFRM